MSVFAGKQGLDLGGIRAVCWRGRGGEEREVVEIMGIDAGAAPQH